MQLNKALMTNLLVADSTGKSMLGNKVSSLSLDGWITINGKTVAIEATCASKYSLLVQCVEIGDLDVIGNLDLNLDGKLIQLGQCRIRRGMVQNDGKWMVIPYETFYDLEKLFSLGKVSVMEPRLTNLPLVLEHKSGISPAFVQYVSDLSYDLNSYAVLLDKLDIQYKDEPFSVQAVMQATIIEHATPGFTEYMDGKGQELLTFVSSLDEAGQGHYGYFFRRQLWNVILRSPILARTNLKPRGYNGDSEMMQMLYLDDHQGDSTFGKLLHKYSVSQPAGQAVRNRRVDISAMLRERLGKGGTAVDGKVRILSVACGPAFEIQDILATKADCEKIHVSLLDQDQEALAEAATLIAKIGTKLEAAISADYIKESVRTMLADKQLEKRWGRFDFIYSLGLFDYLSAPAATAIIKNLYTLLSPGGEMIIGNLSTSNPCRYFMEYWHDWKLIYRTEEDFLKMVPAVPGIEADVRFDATGIQMMLHIKKQAANV